MTHNADQIAEWNGPLGQKWAELQQELDRLTGPFGEAALAAAKPRLGERILDVGCGCGATSLALGEAVGAAGAVLGVDISAPMLDVARKRAANAGLKHVAFEEADASSGALPQDRDLIFSRFGVMFFDDPAGAFTHIRKALKPGGRMAFACWRAPRENPWAMAPLMGARQALNHNPPPADPLAPGPFAFADPDRTVGILSQAGFADVACTPFEADIWLGASPAEAAVNAARTGPLSRLVREFGEEKLPVILAGVEAALKPLAAPDGSIRLPGRTWIVTARAG